MKYNARRTRNKFRRGACETKLTAESDNMDEYMKSIRKYIGRELLMTPGASVFVHSGGRLLLQRRRDNGLWSEHGGCMEPGETAEETARRELFEETGLTAGKLEMIGVFSGREQFYTYPNGDKVCNVNVAYLCENFSGAPLERSDEASELKWFAAGELPEDISPPVLPALRACLALLNSRRASPARGDVPVLVNGVAAFLKNDGRYLLMKRAAGKRIAPGLWSGVGGHMEPREMNDPFAACCREIEEETGIVPRDVVSLGLRYVLTRLSKDEIRQSYIFFGETARDDIIQTDEGELCWAPERELLDREYSETFAAMLAHYVGRDAGDSDVYAGAASDDNGRLRMNWTRLKDWE